MAVLAVDDPDTAEQLAAGARDRLRGSYTYVVVAVAPSAPDAFVSEATRRDVEAERREDWGDAVDRAARLLGGETETVVAQGQPGSAIVNVAEEHGADVIVIGRDAPSTIRKAMGKSVSEHVLDHATCPVLVLPSPAAEGSQPP